MFFVILVIFIVTMFLWGLALAKKISPESAPLFCYVAVLLLGITVFLSGTGYLTKG